MELNLIIIIEEEQHNMGRKSERISFEGERHGNCIRGSYRSLIS